MYKHSTNHFICHFCWLLAKNQDTWMNFLRMSKQPPWQRQKTSYFSKNHREQVRSISGGLRSLRIMQILNRCLEMKVNIYKNITIIMVCAYVKFLIRIVTKQKKKKKFKNGGRPRTRIVEKHFHQLLAHKWAAYIQN